MGKASDTLKSSDAAIVRLDSLISTGSSDLNSLDITDDLAPHLNDPQFDSLEEVCEKRVEDESTEDDYMMPLADAIEDAHRIFYMFVNNKYIEGFQELQKYSKVSFYHSVGKSLVLILRYLFTLKDCYFKEANEAVHTCIRLINRRRHKKSASSRASAFIFKQDFADWTDEEAHAELNFAEITASNALLIITNDQSIGGYVRAAIKMRSSYQTYKECFRILKNRKNWESQVMKKHFESGVYLGLGLFDMAISFLPSKLIKLLEMAGFSGNRSFGISQLLACEKIPDGIRYPAVSLALSGYFGFAEYFYGLGEGRNDCILRVLDHWLDKAPNSVAVTFGLAFREQISGNFQEACRYYTEYTQGQTTIKSFHYISNWQKMWIYACEWDWIRAAENSRFMAEKCRWSPSLFAYVYATHLSMIADEYERPDLMPEILENLKKSILVKRNFGGRRAFHEKLVSEKAKHLIKDPSRMILMPLDLMYLWNIFKFASCNPSALPRVMNRIEDKLKIHRKDSDIEMYAYLLFMKGVCYEESSCPLMAVECFYEILDMEKMIKRERHLIPQSCFEVAQIYRRMNDLNESKKWYKKAQNYTNYVTDVMIQFRVEYALTLIKNSQTTTS